MQRRARELGLRSESAYVARLVRADLQRPAESSDARPLDVARLIASGGWPSRAKEDGDGTA
jgi:hypothetical protein